MALISARAQAGGEQAGGEAAAGSEGRGRSARREFLLGGSVTAGRGDSRLSILLCRAVVIASLSLGSESDAGAGGPYPFPGWATLGHAVAEVLDTDTHAHPPSKLETGPLWSYMVNNILTINNIHYAFIMSHIYPVYCTLCMLEHILLLKYGHLSCTHDRDAAERLRSLLPAQGDAGGCQRTQGSVCAASCPALRVSVEEGFSHLFGVMGHTRAVALTSVLQGGGMCVECTRTTGASWQAQHAPGGCGRAAGPGKNTGSVKKPIHPVCLNSRSANAVLSPGWKQIFVKWDRGAEQRP